MTTRLGLDEVYRLVHIYLPVIEPSSLSPSPDVVANLVRWRCACACDRP